MSNEKSDMTGNTQKPTPANDAAAPTPDTAEDPRGAGKAGNPNGAGKAGNPSGAETAGDDAMPSAGPENGGDTDRQEGEDGLAAAEARIAELEAALAEATDARLRAVAEAENVRKRADKQVAEASRYGSAALARDMLSVSDNLRRAADSVSEEAAAEHALLRQLRDGVLMVERELQAALARQGVKEVSPQPGDRFDHNLHQAMFEMETDDHPPGTVAQTVQAGYVVHDRLLRAAMVGVAKAPAPAPAATDAGADVDADTVLDEDDNNDGG